MKLKLKLLYLPKLSWSENVFKIRNGEGVEKTDRKIVIKVLDTLLNNLRDEFRKFIEAVEKDLEDGFKLIFRGTEIDSSNGENFEKFTKSWKDSQVLLNVERQIEEANKKLLDIKIREELIGYIGDDCKKYISKLDQSIFEEILNSIERGVEERVKNKPKLYNFLDDKIPDEISDMLEKGKKFVPFLTEDEYDAEIKFKAAVLDYLKRYRMYVEGAESIDKDDFKKWIDDALDEAEVWGSKSKHTEFYKRVKCESRSALKTILGRKRRRESKDENRLDMDKITKQLEKIEEGVVVENDKNNGWSIIP